MFANVVIANRGEIACRIIRTARRLKIRTIAIHTPADRGALFTRLADEVHEIGEGANGYLDGPAIVALARQVGASACIPDMASCPRMRISPRLARTQGSSSSGRRPPPCVRSASRTRPRR